MLCSEYRGTAPPAYSTKSKEGVSEVSENCLILLLLARVTLAALVDATIR